MCKWLEEHTKAYKVLSAAMALCGWEHLYSKVHLSEDDVYEILYYSNPDNERDYPLCAIIRGILFDQVPDLYQILK